MKQRTWLQVGQAIGLAVLSPVCAEYLSAYDKQTGDLSALLFGLIFLIPLYGSPAIIVRELSRRAKLGWPGFVSLSAAFGILQAGVIDQSLFSDGYRQLDSWNAMTSGTFIPSIGISLYTAVLFVGGHAIYSFCAPIALMEAFQPNRRWEPWLGVFGLIVCAFLFLLAATLVHIDHLTTETSHASTSQVAGALLVFVILFASPFLTRPRQNALANKPFHRYVFVPLFIGVVAGSTLDLVPPTWLGTMLVITVFAAILILLALTDWKCGDTAGIGAGFLLSRSISAFMYFPLFGNVTGFAKYTHNAILFCIIATLSYFALKRALSDSPEQLADVARIAEQSREPEHAIRRF